MQIITDVIQHLKFSDNEPKRLFHGRGGLYAGLEFINVDWLCPVLLITLYEAVDDDWLDALLKVLVDAAPVDMQSIVVQRRYLKPVIFETLYGEPVSRFGISEEGLRYQLDFNAGMHTGLFLDMATARQWVREHSAGKKVLNLFSYTCAFSVAAIAGDAESVVNMDLSRPSLTRGRESHRLNGHDMSRVAFHAHDIFRSWGKLKRLGPFDLVIVDPPSFQKGSFVLAKDYPRVVRQLPALLAEGGEVLACLNDPDQSTEYLLELFAEQCPELKYKQRLANPETFADRDEERALKVLRFQR